MAFCTNCGSTMDANAHFCTKCGKGVTPSATMQSGAAAAPAPTQPAAYTPPVAGQPASGGSNVLKIVLIVGGVLCLIFVFFVGSLLYIGHRVSKRIKSGVHVSQDGTTSSVDLPGFKASTNKASARDLARKIGVDLYPGATPQGDSSEAQFGNMTTATINLTTSDSLQQVADFYKSRYSNAMTSTQNSNEFTLVSTDKDGTVTITAKNYGNDTNIEIAKVGGLKFNVTTH